MSASRDAERRGSCAARHWFAYYGSPGTSSPTCRRCGAPNPRYRPQRDPRRVFADIDFAAEVKADAIDALFSRTEGSS